MKKTSNLESGEEMRIKELQIMEIAFATDSATCWFDLGQLYLKARNYPRAEAAFTYCLRINPQHWEAKRLLAKIYDLEEKSRKARSLKKNFPARMFSGVP